MDFFINILKLIFYKFSAQKTIIINEAAGLGDYLWVRSYFKLLKTSEKYRNYKIIFCGTKRWKDFAQKVDSKYVDIFLFFKDPYKPKFLEIFLLKMFKFDIFVNFRAASKQWDIISNTVKAQNVYTNKLNFPENAFYDTRNKIVMSQIIDIPSDFKHTLDYGNLKPRLKLKQPYIIIVFGGYTEGYLSKEQICSIINEIYKNYNGCILLLGTKMDKKRYDRICNSVPSELKEKLICGCGVFKESELPYVIDKADFVITTNTSIWHFAILLNKKGICFSHNQKWIYHRTDLFQYLTADKNISDIKSREICDAIKQLQNTNSL